MPAISARNRPRRTISEINMVPFIDVMLVLLIIFMVTAPLITPSVINLPSVDRASRVSDRPLEIVVRNDRMVELKKDPGGASLPQQMPLSELGASVRAAQQGDAQRPVVISADRSVRYETVVAVMNQLKRAGIERVGLAVQASPAAP